MKNYNKKIHLNENLYFLLVDLYREAKSDGIIDDKKINIFISNFLSQEYPKISKKIIKKIKKEGGIIKLAEY